jgi:general secretion pathway protein D
MRWMCLSLVICGLTVAAAGADQPQSVVGLPCAPTFSSTPGCEPSKTDLKKAKQAFSKGMKLEKSKHLDEAYQEFDSAARLSPKNLDYLTVLAMTRQQLVYDHLQRGNDDLLKSKNVAAQAEFQTAITLDPENDFARQQLSESLGEWAPKLKGNIRVVEDSGELRVAPKQVRAEFHFRGDARALLSQVASTYGIAADVDDSVVSRRVHFDIDPVDFRTAMDAACMVTGAFWTPLSEKQVYLLKDTAENHRQFDRLALRSFYVPTSTPQDLNDIVNVLRVVFEARFLMPSAQTGMITVRAPVPVLDAITQLMEGFGTARPQVMLDVEVFEIDHQLTRNMGVHIPNQFNLYNIPAAALAALGGQSLQSLVNQLISGGGINQANSTAISALLAQLQGQGGQNSIFSQPLATFGNGLTLFGLSLDQLSGQLSLNESWVKTLQHSTIRAAQNADTNFRIGTRYPILNASFAPVFNTPAISQVLQNNSFQAPYPSFTYEDIGLIVKAKPNVNSNLDVGLALEIELRTLAGQSYNGVPVIANRQYKGSITLVNGEPAVVVGEVTRSEQLSLTGIPGLGSLPGLSKIMSTNSKTEEDDELMIVITPHVLNAKQYQDSEIWISKQ